MTIEIVEDKSLLFLNAAGLIIRHLKEAIVEKDSATLVVAGGSTFSPVYRLLASEEYFHQVPWSKVTIYFGDERCVPPGDDRSNFKIVQQIWLSRFDAMEEKPTIHRIKGEDVPARAAKEYAELLTPQFDVVLLGLGSDGHTASLFPAEESRWKGAGLVVTVEAGLPPYVQRVTLSLEALSRAKYALVMVSGEEKTEIAQDAFYNHSKRYPINEVLDKIGNAQVFLDKAVLPAAWFL
jgi:6-phosphogluconolactonase